MLISPTLVIIKKLTIKRGRFIMKQRLIYLDWLRIYAIITVVTIHTSAGIVSNNLNTIPISNWLAANFYESISRPSVPLFVMISGALMLSNSKEIKYKSFLQKRISKIIIPLLGWSFIYYSYNVYRGDHYPFFSLSQFIKLFLTNGISVHFWFMYMILGIYLITPLIKIFIQNASMKDIHYFLILWIYASVIVKFMNFYFGYSFNIELYYVTNYVGYFILGYYLSNIPISSKLKKISFVSAVVGTCSTFLLTYFSTKNGSGALQEFWYEYLSPNVLFSAVGIFVFIRSTRINTNKIPVIFEKLSNVSFGIYLIHILVLQVLSNEIFDPIRNHFPSIISIPLSVLITIIISGFSSFILSKIPLFKWLVP